MYHAFQQIMQAFFKRNYSVLIIASLLKLPKSKAFDRPKGGRTIVFA